MAADEDQDRTADSAEQPGRSNGGQAPSRARPRRQPPANSIQAGRRRTRGRPARDEGPGAAPEGPPSASRAPPGDPKAGPKASRADSDPWTVPESVRDRFVQDGHRFYFPDGHPAFRDLGRRLTTASENTQVVHSLVEIARARHWNEITVAGTERFRHEAWSQARLAGLTVRGFRPSEEQQAQLVRALGRTLGRSAERADAVSEAPLAAAAVQTGSARSPSDAREPIAGKLLDHGRDAYRHDPNEEPSYFVQIQTRDGRREIWGKDLDRAVAKSLTQPQIGDEVILQRTGRESVTVKRRERGAAGALTEKEVEVFRNRWVLESQAFFERRARAAEIVRNEHISAKEAVQETPELAGTYLTLRAAELAARRLRDPEDQKRFVTQVRRVLAEDIQRGEPLPPVRMRERPEAAADRSQVTKTRTATREDLERTA